MRKGAALLLVFAMLGGCVKQSPVERAQQLVRMHREQEAKETLEKHLAQNPRDVAVRRMYIRVLAWSGDIEGARREVETLEKELPGDPVPWIELGHAFELAHRFEEALAAYDTAASVAPQSAAGPREGGMRCARWGEPEEAAARLEEAVRRGANDAETFHVLGLVRVNLHDLVGAEEAYRRGIAIHKNSVENLLGLATIAVVREDGGAALAAYDAILHLKPHHAGAALGRAWALGKLGRRSEAEKALDFAAELGASPEHIERQRAALRAKGSL